MAIGKYRLSVSAAQIDIMIEAMERMIQSNGGNNGEIYQLVGYLHSFNSKVESGTVSAGYIQKDQNNNSSFRVRTNSGSNNNADLRENKRLAIWHRFLREPSKLTTAEADEAFTYYTNSGLSLRYIEGMLHYLQFVRSFDAAAIFDATQYKEADMNAFYAYRNSLGIGYTVIDGNDSGNGPESAESKLNPEQIGIIKDLNL